MARPHHELQEDPASDTDGNSHHRTNPTSLDRPSTKSPWRQAVETLPPPFFALLFVLAAIAIYFLFSSHLAPSPSSSSIPSRFPPAHTSNPYSRISQDTKQQQTMSSAEQTFIAIKPDGVQRGLIGPIISRFENRGYKLAAIKLVSPGKAHLENHYADLKGKPFFPGLIEYMSSGPICAMVWEGRDAVKTGRTLLGATNPLASAPGTIRGDFAIDVGRNVCHGSDSVENAKKEIALWFKEGDVVSYKQSQFDWVYEKA
ncbi:nucleoside diphosphate kinase A [Moelleriella libera RCEF 2490]|uniref:Nucleoside diphosphate kinase n=1 Tax=Moelleriella libera RCEF 2490 TaxID=1081109 RepID=A0A167ZQ48_9HYPO|nr:nucleoside diphosphate kinase A [Moelleriella libera RCEF 2490]